MSPQATSHRSFAANRRAAITHAPSTDRAVARHSIGLSPVPSRRCDVLSLDKVARHKTRLSGFRAVQNSHFICEESHFDHMAPGSAWHSPNRACQHHLSHANIVVCHRQLSESMVHLVDHASAFGRMRVARSNQSRMERRKPGRSCSPSRLSASVSVTTASGEW